MLRNYVEVEEGRVAISAAPQTAADVNWMVSQGIQCLFSLHPVGDGARARLAELDLLWVECLVSDFSRELPPNFRQTVIAAVECISWKPKVLIHCQGGGGRSYSFYALTLLERHLPMAPALSQVEKEPQRAFVHGYAAALCYDGEEPGGSPDAT